MRRPIRSISSAPASVPNRLVSHTDALKNKVAVVDSAPTLLSTSGVAIDEIEPEKQLSVNTSATRSTRRPCGGPSSSV